MIGWLYWTVYQLLSFALTIVGWFLVAVLAGAKLWVFRPGLSSMFPNREVWAWRGGWLTWLWSNEENGICGGVLPTPLAAYKWSALRNPTNNMRFLPGAAFLTVKAQIKVSQTASLVIITHGWRQCRIYLRNGKPWLRIGWLMHVDDGDGWRSWPVFELNPGKI